MPGRCTVLGLPDRRTESRAAAAAGPAIMTVPAGIDPAAAADVGMALRVPAFVIVTLALGLGAHITAGGGPPSPGSAVVIGVLLTIAGRLFALREQSLPRLITMVWAVQAGIHFVTMAGHQHSGTHLDPLRLGHHHLHLPPTAPPVPQVPPIPFVRPFAPQWTVLTAASDPGGSSAAGTVVAAMDHSNSTLMLTLHAAAGLVVAAWLRRGEAVAFAAASRLLPRLFLRRFRLVVRPVILRTLPVCTAPRRLSGQRFICLAAPRRGPPLPAV